MNRKLLEDLYEVKIQQAYVKGVGNCYFIVGVEKPFEFVSDVEEYLSEVKYEKTEQQTVENLPLP